MTESEAVEEKSPKEANELGFTFKTFRLEGRKMIVVLLTQNFDKPPAKDEKDLLETMKFELIGPYFAYK